MRRQGGVSGVRGHVRPVLSLTDRQSHEWRKLAAAAIEPNPLFEPSCVVPAAQHLPGGGRISLVTAEASDGTMLACMPVRPAVRWRPASVPTLTTDVRRMTYLGTPLVSPDRPAEAVAAMLRAVVAARQETGCRLAEVKWVRAGPVDRLVQRAISELGLTSVVSESFVRPFVFRRSDGSYFDFNSKYRGVIKRRRRQLGAELGGDVELLDRAGTPEALELLIALEARGYKGASGIALATAPGEPEQFRAMARSFGAGGRLQLLSLEAAGRPVAMQMAVRGGDGVFALKVAYDEELSRFGPGVELQVGSIRHFHEHTDAAWIDSCTYGGNELLERLYPDRQRIVSYLVALGGAPEKALLKALPHLRTARRRAREGRDRLSRPRHAAAV